MEELQIIDETTDEEIYQAVLDAQQAQAQEDRDNVDNDTPVPLS